METTFKSYENSLFTEEWEQREFLATVLYLPQRKVNVYNTLAEAKNLFLGETQFAWVQYSLHPCHWVFRVLIKMQYYIFKIKTISKDMPAIHVDVPTQPQP